MTCPHCGGSCGYLTQYYSWRKGMWIERCLACDRRTFDLMFAGAIVAGVLIAAVVCALLGRWR